METNDTADVALRDTEIFKIKLSFSSLTNRVVVCPVVANLYSWKPSDTETWNHFKTGVPVLVIVHDGQSSGKNVQMQLCIVDRQNGFATWRENITEQSDYKMSQRNFHTMKLGSPKEEEGEMVGIKFPSEEVASVFYKDVECNIPEDVSLEVLGSSPKHDKKKSTRASKKLSKTDISSPCMFTHVTSINNSSFSGTNDKKSSSSENGRPKSGLVKKTLSFSMRKR